MSKYDDDKRAHGDAVRAMYKILHLEDPDVYALKAIEQNAAKHRTQRASTPQQYLRQVGRARGRTTRMCVSALVHMQQGRRIVIAASSEEQARGIVRQIREWARYLNIDPLLVSQVDGNSRRFEATYFTDHHRRDGENLDDGFDD